MTRPPEIVRWEDIEGPEWSYKGRSEKMGRDADFSTHFGFDRFGVHHVRLEPGRRTSLPHAESVEDEFIFVIEGTPEVWIDGHLHRLVPGDAVGFKAGTGVSHTFLNNSDSVVRMIVVGDRARADGRILYPLDPDRKPLRDDWWDDAPARALGPHDGLPTSPRNGG
jgi:uncharacterized cupin superfamily protein